MLSSGVYTVRVRMITDGKEELLMFKNLLRNNNFHEKTSQIIDTPFWSINL